MTTRHHAHVQGIHHLTATGLPVTQRVSVRCQIQAWQCPIATRNHRALPVRITSLLNSKIYCELNCRFSHEGGHIHKL